MYIYEALTLEINIFKHRNKLKIHFLVDFLYLCFFFGKDINYIIKKIEFQLQFLKCKSFIEIDTTECYKTTQKKRKSQDFLLISTKEFLIKTFYYFL